MEHLADDDLLALADGRRRLDEAPAVEEHLAACARCCAALAAIGEDEPAPAPVDLAGRTIGPYRIEARIGAGGGGEVYRARDERLGRAVAIKLVAARASDPDGHGRRLAAEARAAAAIAHPNVVTVHDVGEIEGRPFVVSELADGEQLASRIARGGVGVDETIRLGVQLARGVAAAHAEGVVHRDLKPANLIITRDGTLKILDFGLAKITGAAGELDTTEPGTVLGTWGYLAPEQARGEPAGVRADLFAIGAILYELATGERAFGGSSVAERLTAVLRDTPRRLGELGPLAPIVTRLLEKDPARRFESAADLAWALEQLAAEDAPAAPARPTRRTLLGVGLGLGAGLLGGAAVGSVVGRRSRPARPPLETPSFQPVTFRHGRVSRARFTPDGGSAIYSAAWDGLALELFSVRLGGGSAQTFDLPSADLLDVSSRGELAIALDRRHVEGFHWAGRLARMPLEGAAPHELLDDVQEAEFTPDGEELAVVRRAGGAFRLELPAGTVVHEAPWISHPRISPDGRWLAFGIHPDPGDDAGAVMLIDLRGRRGRGSARALADGWSTLAGIAWAPDSRRVWFTAARTGFNSAIHTVALDGTTALVAQITGRARVHDVSTDGRALITADAARLRMMVRAAGAPEDVDLSLTDITMVAGMTPDGDTIAFGEYGEASQAPGCFLRSARGGKPVRLGDGGPMALSDDGQRVAALVYGDPMRVRVYSTAVGGGREIALGPIAQVHHACWRGDELILGGAASGRPPRLWRVPSAGAPSPITDEGVAGKPAVSPDGARLAMIDGDGRLRIVTIDSGRVDVVRGDRAGQRVCRWHADGASLLVRGVTVPIEVRRLELATGISSVAATIVPPALGRKGVDAVVVSATGDAYAYSYGQELSRLYAMTVA